MKNKNKDDDTISDDHSLGTFDKRGRRMSGYRTTDSKKLSNLRKEASSHHPVHEANEDEESSP